MLSMLLAFLIVVVAVAVGDAAMCAGDTAAIDAATATTTTTATQCTVMLLSLSIEKTGENGEQKHLGPRTDTEFIRPQQMSGAVNFP